MKWNVERHRPHQRRRRRLQPGGAVPATISSEVAALVFTPTAGAAGSSSTTTFTLSDTSSAFATATVNSTTTVIDTDPAAAPTISGTVAGQPTISEAQVHPFSGVTIADPNSGATDTLTITLSGGGKWNVERHRPHQRRRRRLQPGGGAPATISTRTRCAGFHADRRRRRLQHAHPFTLSDTSSAFATATVNTTTTVIDTDPAAAPTISGTVAGQTTISEAQVHPFSGVTIADPNSGATDTLTITLSNSANGTLSGTALINDGGGVYSLAAASPATISSELAALVFTPTAGAAGSSRPPPSR